MALFNYRAKQMNEPKGTKIFKAKLLARYAYEIRVQVGDKKVWLRRYHITTLENIDGLRRGITFEFRMSNAMAIQKGLI